MDYWIAPSLLSANWARLGEEAEQVLKAGADMLHLDVMDNHFVKNLTVGPQVCEALRNEGIRAPIDVHLMTKPVDDLICAFARAGASRISFHPEATEDLGRSLDWVREQHCEVGLAISPETPLEAFRNYFDKLDFVLMMSVNPGFGGQAFIPESLDKIKKAAALLKQADKKIRLAVDGGVKLENIAEVARSGADTFILGSGIFHAKDYRKMIDDLRVQLKQV